MGRGQHRPARAFGVDAVRDASLGSASWTFFFPKHRLARVALVTCLHWSRELSLGAEERTGPGRRTVVLRGWPRSRDHTGADGTGRAGAAAAVLSGVLGGTACPGPARGTSDGPICRICHEGSSGEVLLSPCDCTGTLGTVHKSCLEKWLSSSNTSYCELCHTEFVVERRPRPFTEVSFRYHCQLYSEWRRTNQKVRLMILDSESCKMAQHSLLSAMLLKKTAEETTV
ncbi:E3 ubiquitin-protein ligase MARCHF2 isoform X2 [Sminthopsis crassicaudata]|uniref:E3 ubiquitin-protein ligase MARCHF2 isoform X2 n=1 Tax=Sminthopsis crassicaudata TaxID=9301 RepID=UPI003D6872C1